MRGRGHTAALSAAAAIMTVFSGGVSADDTRMYRLMTLDPGHFHAALVQKFMYADVDPVVHVFAPSPTLPRAAREGASAPSPTLPRAAREGPLASSPTLPLGDDVAQHLKRIESFNTRSDDPTRWETRTYTGTDFLEKMLEEKPGNIVVLAGNNARKTDYILRSVEAGLNVLADKPMAITPQDFEKLKRAFEVAEANGVLLYDIMTERFEITSILQRALSQDRELFGELVRGTPQEPAIVKESVHHFSKIAAGAPLIRPQWFFDVRQQGEGIVDVTTHLVDLVQWQAFPERALDPSDAKVLSARRWSTTLTPAQFKRVTGADSFPEYLERDLHDGNLEVYSNGEFTYRLRDVHARISVIWNFEAPPGAGDTHFSTMRGSKAALTIRQGEAEQYRPVLYITKAGDVSASDHEKSVRTAIASLQSTYPGIGVRRAAEAENADWVVTVPERYNVGHEAHFAQVTENFLRYLRSGTLPEWEVPNMLTKYATIMQAYEMSRHTGIPDSAAHNR